LKLFTEKELIYRENKGPFMPTKSSKNIMLKELFDLINEAQVTIPPSFKKAVSKGNIVDIFNKINTGRNQILGTMTLGDLKFS